ncbi:MAG TPA: hypothetical protein VFU31_26020 [Candidatus Binatia bacterium]|nr:hypothetical protein [Candidatus Binatia bacterium]
MRPICLAITTTIFLGVFVAGLPLRGHAATLLTQENASRVASLRNLKIGKDGEVSGEVVNHSKQTLRDVQLQILYSWRWKDEFRPGTSDPGTAAHYVIDKEIPPGQSIPFRYKPSAPLPSRADGHFETTVTIAGFAEVFR